MVSAALGLIDAYADSGDERALEMLTDALGVDGIGIADPSSSSSSPELAAFCANFATLRGSGLPLHLLRESPEKIVRELAAAAAVTSISADGVAEKYGRALALAARAGIPAYPVHLARAAEMVAQHKSQQSIWADKAERMALWRRVHKYLVESVRTDPDARAAAGNFFMTEASRDSESGDIKFPEEHLLLLSLALAWFTGRQDTVNADCNDGFNDASEMLAEDDSTKLDYEGRLCKPVEFVRNLEARVALLKVCTLAGIPFPTKEEEGNSSTSISNNNNDNAALSRAVDYLINADKLSSARSLAQRFGFQSTSLDAAERMTRIAAAAAGGDGIGDDGTEKHQQGSAVAAKLAELAKASNGIKKYGLRVLTDFQAAEMLGESYNSIVGSSNSKGSSEHTLEVLARVALTRNSKANELSRNFISSHSLDSRAVANALAEHFIIWLEQHSHKEEGEPLRNVMVREWPRETLVCYASLSEDVPAVVARLFQELSAPREAPLGCEVATELAVACWVLYENVGSSAGCQAVLSRVKEMLPQFVDEGEFYLLRRIITGTCAFRELYLLMDALYAADQFEVMLMGKVAGDPSDDAIGGALLQYMTLRHPDDPDHYQQICLRFGFFNEIGRRLEAAATAKLVAATATLCPQRKDAQSQALPTHEAAMASIADAIQDLIQAADHYTMSQACQSTRRCFNLAVLASLQARCPETLFIGLTRDEARRVMAQQHLFCDAVAVANVYGLHEEWVRPVYAQVILAGNLTYLDELRYSYNIPPKMWWDVARLYEMDIAKAHRQQQQPQQQQAQAQAQQTMSETVKAKNMRALLTRIEDYFLQYDIAVKLHFDDIASRLKATVPGLRCFRK